MTASGNLPDRVLWNKCQTDITNESAPPDLISGLFRDSRSAVAGMLCALDVEFGVMWVG